MKAAAMFLALAIAAVANASGKRGALAHDAPSGWEYDLSCCSTRDCAPVPPPRVTPDGLVFTVPKGRHPATMDAPLTVRVPHNDRAIKPSGDGDWHLCIHPELKTFYCAYQPPGGV
jgi:hypothetical protein